jgi:hypothetical protein
VRASPQGALVVTIGLDLVGNRNLVAPCPKEPRSHRHRVVALHEDRVGDVDRLHRLEDRMIDGIGQPILEFSVGRGPRAPIA